MKLIREFTEDTQIITEEKNGVKQLFVEGIFLQSNIKNRNGRIYPQEIMDKEVQRYIKESINTNRAMGELGHPENPSINLDKVSHKIVSLVKEGNNWRGKALILDTPMGNIARGLIGGGVTLGTSSRALGTLKEQNGVKIVQNDFTLATAGDLVADPSAPDAFLEGIMESKEWVFINGMFEEVDIDRTKKIIKSTKKADLKEMSLKEFASFLNAIK